jgi:predicted Fe-Mo cluster-binding NifX family protein
MNVCIPVLEDKGLQSRVSQHFGSAPAFIVVNTESGECRTIENQDLHHAHGMCQPLSSLNGECIDAIVAGGIGAGALSKLRAAGLEVFCSEHPTVGGAIAALKEGRLPKVNPATACGHHGHGHHQACCHEGASEE